MSDNGNTVVDSNNNAAAAANTEEIPSVASRAFTFFNNALLMYFVVNFMFSGSIFGPPKTSNVDSSGVNENQNQKGHVNIAQQKVELQKRPYSNAFSADKDIDIAVYISEQSVKDGYVLDKNDLVWKYHTTYGDWDPKPKDDNSFSFSTKISLSENIQNNGTLYAHTFISSAGKNSENPPITLQKEFALMQYRVREKIVKKRLLLESYTGEEEECSGEDGDSLYSEDRNMNSEPQCSTKRSGENENESELKDIISYYHPNFTVNLMYDETKYRPRDFPPNIQKLFVFDDDAATYTPQIFVNTFWNLYKDYYPVNSTLSELDFHLEFYPLSLMKMQMYAQMTESFEAQSKFGASKPKDNDVFKEMLIDTNPLLLALTFVVTILHSLFDFLAFKNDITFWKNKKTIEGLSVRTIFTNCFFQFVILLYLYDNETSYVILISSSIGLVIELWKIKKAVNIKIDFSEKWLNFIPKIRLEDRKSYSETKTKQYDDQAFNVLSKLAVPLIIGYSIYSLFYTEHKSVYSWVLGSVVGAIYTFGFIMMTPQLFINYKLKSVAHMPWRMMTYKVLNTFIDDLFAFIIKMPIMHRLACFRDDIIFFIYLYQMYAYPVDPTRRNEYEGGDGASQEDENICNGDDEGVVQEIITNSTNGSNFGKKDNNKNINKGDHNDDHNDDNEKDAAAGKKKEKNTVGKPNVNSDSEKELNI